MEALDLIPGFEVSVLDFDTNEPITSPELVAAALTATFGLAVQPHELEHQQDDSWHVPLTRETAEQLVTNGFWGVETCVGPNDADAVRVSIEAEWPAEAPATW